jgi:hypothetical protein
MNYQYQLTNNNTIIRLPDGLSFEPDPNLSIYEEYLQWVREGNIPKPYESSTSNEEIIQSQSSDRKLTLDIYSIPTYNL